SGAPAAGATNFEIGALGNGLATTFFTGSLDEVAVRNIAADQSVIRAEYQAGRGVAVVRTETTYGVIGPTTSWTHLAANPSQSATQLIRNGDFEEGLTGRNANHGA